MKRYHLTCPNCGEKDIAISLDKPEEPFCRNEDCESPELDIEEIRKMVTGWQEYLDDVDELLASEAKALKESGKEQKDNSKRK